MESIETIVERLEPGLAALEQRRMDAVHRQGHAWVVTAGVGLVAFVIAITGGQSLFPVSLMFALIATIIVGAIIQHLVAGPAQREFVCGFKTDVVRELVALMAPQLDYFPEQGISRDAFRAMRLFTTAPDRYVTEDLLTGRIGETEVAIAEVCAEERRTRTDSDGKSQTYYVTIFDGVLLTADFHKDFQAATLVLPDNEKGFFSGIGKAIQGFFPFGRDELVRLEDPEFESHFAVYSSDQVEARYLLSSSLMQRILELRSIWGEVPVRLSFIDSKIHVAIPCSRDLFEPRLDQSLTDSDFLHRLVSEIRSCLDLVEQLNLDRRIWSRRSTSPEAGNPLDG